MFFAMLLFILVVRIANPHQRGTPYLDKTPELTHLLYVRIKNAYTHNRRIANSDGRGPDIA